MGCTYIGNQRLGSNSTTLYKYTIDSVGASASSTFSIDAPSQGTIIGMNVVQLSTDLTFYVMDEDAGKTHPAKGDLIKASLNKYIKENDIVVPYKTRAGTDYLFGEILNNAAITTGTITFELIIA